MTSPMGAVPPVGVKSALSSVSALGRAETLNHHEKVLYLYDSRFGAGNQGGNYGNYT